LRAMSFKWVHIPRLCHVDLFIFHKRHCISHNLRHFN